MMAVAEGEARETSLANEPRGPLAADRYHRECFLRLSTGKREASNQRARAGLPVPAGADDGPIAVVEYDPSWPDCYLGERKRLAPLLPGSLIHHIGSTAVPQLAAKPIIDMMALVDDLESNVDTVVRRAGYRLPERFNRNLSHRRYLCYPGTHFRTHHLHLVDAPEQLERCLRFRDLLRAEPQLADEYAALKRALAERFRSDREGYTKAKTDFIRDAEDHLSCDRTLVGQRCGSMGH